MTTEQTSLFIKNLKNRLSSSQSRLSQTLLSTTKDTALWEIEALLNFDFDNAQNPVPTSLDTLKYDLNINDTGNIDYSEISNAYNTLSNKINLHLSANTHEKVKLVDVSAVVINNILHAEAYVVYTIDNSEHKVATSPCDPITVSAHWSNLTGPSSCSASNHGPDLCNRRLNCSQYTCGNGGTVYYTNISSITYNGNVSGSLFYRYTPVVLYPCTEPPLISASDLNNKVSAAQSYANTNKPTSPAGIVITNYNFQGQYNMAYAGASYIATYWNLTVTYGTVNCSGAPN